MPNAKAWFYSRSGFGHTSGSYPQTTEEQVRIQTSVAHVSTIEDFPNIRALAKRLEDVCETCHENLARFDCERCGKRTCNHCKTSSEFLTGAKFCTSECVTEAENDDYLNRKSGC